MRHAKKCLPVVLIFSLLTCGPAYALDIPYRQPPFNVFTWPVQILWYVLMAPVECAKGFGKTLNTLVLPPDRQLPPMESIKLPKLQAPQEKGTQGAPASAKTDPGK